MAERIHWWTERCLQWPLHPQLLDISIYLSVCLSIYLSICLSASLKTTLFCETASVLVLNFDNIKNAAILRDKSPAPATQHPICLSIGLSIDLSSYLSICPAAYLSIHVPIYVSICLSILANLKIWCSKMEPLSGRWNASFQILFKRPTPAIVFGHPTKPSRFGSLFWIPCACHTNHTWTFKSGPSMWCSMHFDLEMCFAPQQRALSRRVNSQNCPTLRCFVHFDFEMCFAPQRRALFRHLNFQECSDTEVFCAHWLRNVLRATTVCTFSTSQLPKVLGHGALYVFTSKCASRHNGVHFLILHLARWLRTRRFSEPTFRPSGATNHWKKHGVSRLFYLSRTCIFFLLTLSLLWYSLFFFSLLWLFTPLLFHLSILSEVWLLYFLW